MHCVGKMQSLLMLKQLVYIVTTVLYRVLTDIQIQAHRPCTESTPLLLITELWSEVPKNPLTEQTEVWNAR
jgi:hypothetical protein